MEQNSISFSLVLPRFILFRLDVFPFVILYGLMVWAYWNVDQFSDWNIYIRLALIGIGFFNCLTYIFGYWSKKAQAIIQYRILTGKLNQNLPKASHVYVTQKREGYNRNYGICDLFVQQNDTRSIYFFHFQQRKFYYNSTNNSFERMKPQLISKPIDQILASRFDQSRQENNNFYDYNILEIPIRPFWDIFRDQIIDPFAFFQLFSVFLWMLDENRVYCIMILVMLVGSAYAISLQRFKTLVGFRSMTLAPHEVWILSQNNWKKVPSYDLKPADIIIIEPGYQHKKTPYETLTDDQYMAQTVPFGLRLPSKMLHQQNKPDHTSHKNVPCDILLIGGTCVANEAILTGEAIPQVKQSIGIADLNQPFSQAQFKQNILFCGTEILQINDQPELHLLPHLLRNRQIPKPPVNGCIGMVLTTGFDTSKGKLIRKVMANTQSLQVEQKDGLWIILFLLICSIFTSVYVLKEGMKNQDRSKQKLFLRCILIITTVVPPQLPMILTLAVNNSILYLQKKRIFVSEPKKIPLGGKVNVIAFDKTGTLTEDKFIFEGILDDLKNYKTMKEISKASPENSWVLAGCHSLILVEKQLTGDPIEMMFFNLSKWTYTSKNKQARNGQEKIVIKKIFSFKSELKRMSTFVQHVTLQGKYTGKVLTKGAPEAIQKLLKIVPQGYKEAYSHYTRQGYRLLALAYRQAGIQQFSSEDKSHERQKAESNLTFAGFFICSSPLKQDTLVNIRKLHKAAYRIIIITGDNILTAIKVGLTLEMGTNVLTIQREGEKIVLTVDEDNYQISCVEDLRKYLGGSSLLCTSSTKDLPAEYYPYIKIFARTSPNDKQHIVKSIKQLTGDGVLYAGDGTNDVGGLRIADVGVAVVGTSNLTQVQQKQNHVKLEDQEFKRKMTQLRNDVVMPWRKKLQTMNKMNAAHMVKKKTNHMEFMMGDDIKVGDACIAAPFTSKHSNSIKCVLIIIRQAVATLVTTIQTYKILGISSMLQAYSLASMNMTNLKYSEKQSTVIGILASINFYYFSNAKPLKNISHIRAPHTIFNIWFMISFFGQIFIFLGCNYYAMNHIGLKYVLEEDKQLSADSGFKKSFINTVIFLFLGISQSAVFIVNHGGQPHMMSLIKNSRYFKFLFIPMILCFVLTANIFPSFSEFVDLKYDGIPYEVNIQMLAVFGIMVISTYFLDRMCRFAQYKEIVGWF